MVQKFSPKGLMSRDVSWSVLVHLGVLGCAVLGLPFLGLKVSGLETPTSTRWLIEVDSSPFPTPSQIRHPIQPKAKRSQGRPSHGTDPGVNSYLAKVHQRIQEELTYPAKVRRRRIEGTVHLRLRINSDGNLDASWIEDSSGSELLDRLALDAVARAEPFQPLPESQEGLEIQLPVEFRLF